MGEPNFQCSDIFLLLEQYAALRVFNGNSQLLRSLVDSYFPSELVLRNGSVIELPFTKDAHLGAWSPTVDNLRPQTIHEEPGAVALVLLCFQTPTSFVSDGILVEAFGCYTTCFG